jgi:hypothetical protein
LSVGAKLVEGIAVENTEDVVVSVSSRKVFDQQTFPMEFGIREIRAFEGVVVEVGSLGEETLGVKL